MRKNLIRGLVLIFSVTLVITQPVSAQKSMINYLEPGVFSVGMQFGMTDLWGDVGTKGLIDHYANSDRWKRSKFIGGISVGYAWHPSFKTRIDINYGTLYASDKFNKNKAISAANPEADPYQRYVRNQDVKSLIWEGDFLFEFTPLRMNIDGRGALRRMQPYIVAGVGGYHFNAKGYHVSREGFELGWTPLYDLNIEGNGWNIEGSPKRYNKWQLNIPMGLGLKWDLSDNLTFGVEYLYRYCFTDYLDNVSAAYLPQEYYAAKFESRQAALAGDLADKSWEILGDKNYYHSAGELRGNSSNKDSYSSLNLRLYWRLLSNKRAWW